MINRSALNRLYIKPIESGCSREYTCAHILHLEIWTSLLFVKVEFFLAYLLCVICPVPRLYGASDRQQAGSRILVHSLLQVLQLLLRLCYGRGDNSLQELIYGLGVAGHLVCKYAIGRSVIAQQAGFMLTEFKYAQESLPRIILSAVCSTCGIGLEHPLAQGSVFAAPHSRSISGNADSEFTCKGIVLGK